MTVAPPLEVLVDVDTDAPADLPVRLTELYGGALSLPRSRVCANLVASIDGVVALDPRHRASGPDISLGHPSDRLVMAILRAWSDVVLIGAGTLRVHRRETWLPSKLLPPLATDLGELRRNLGRAADPALAVVTASGEIDPAHPALERGAVILTAAGMGERLRARLPSSCTVAELSTLEGPAIVAALRSHGLEAVLSEGGPHLIGTLARAACLDDLFVTISPLLAGRDDGDDRLGLVAGVHLLPDVVVRMELASLRRAGSYLFLRYRRPAPHDNPPSPPPA